MSDDRLDQLSDEELDSELFDILSAGHPLSSALPPAAGFPFFVRPRSPDPTPVQARSLRSPMFGF